MDNNATSSDGRQSYLEDVFAAGGTGAVSSLESLTGALKVGFRLLRILMVVLAVVFLFSNIFWVPEGCVAVQSRLGRIVGNETASVRPPGGPYLAFPYPVDTIARIPTTIQKLTLYNAFWSETDTFEPVIDDRPESRGLRPGVHGSLVTADKNLVQGVWIIHYKLDYTVGDPNTASAVTRFIQNVGTLDRAEEIIRRTAQSAIVRVVSGTLVSDFVSGNIDNARIREIIAERLTALDTGIHITSVSAGKYAAPKVLMPDFEAVSQAESQKALAIEQASRRRVSTLNELAGSEWQVLLDAIETYEAALRRDDKILAQAAYEAAGSIFLSSEVGGAVKQMLDEARSEKTAAIQRTRAAVARFTELLPAYEKTGLVFESQLIQDTVKEIWSSISVDALYIPKERRFYLNLGGQSLSME